jgi:hypothetical protein
MACYLGKRGGSRGRGGTHKTKSKVVLSEEPISMQDTETEMSDMVTCGACKLQLPRTMYVSIFGFFTYFTY